MYVHQARTHSSRTRTGVDEYIRSWCTQSYKHAFFTYTCTLSGSCEHLCTHIDKHPRSYTYPHPPASSRVTGKAELTRTDDDQNVRSVYMTIATTFWLPVWWSLLRSYRIPNESNELSKEITLIKLKVKVQYIRKAILTAAR